MGDGASLEDCLPSSQESPLVSHAALLRAGTGNIFGKRQEGKKEKQRRKEGAKTSLALNDQEMLTPHSEGSPRIRKSPAPQRRSAPLSGPEGRC